jgi:hypothetical protein
MKLKSNGHTIIQRRPHQPNTCIANASETDLLPHNMIEFKTQGVIVGQNGLLKSE